MNISVSHQKQVWLRTTQLCYLDGGGGGVFTRVINWASNELSRPILADVLISN